MRHSRHSILAGSGALAFARQQGFAEEDLSTPSSRAAFVPSRRERSTLSQVPLKHLHILHLFIFFICLCLFLFWPASYEEHCKAKKKQGPPGHDTLGMLALDANGNLAACVSTSGMVVSSGIRVP